MNSSGVEIRHSGRHRLEFCCRENIRYHYPSKWLVHIITVNELDLPIGGIHENPDPENPGDEHVENGRTASVSIRGK